MGEITVKFFTLLKLALNLSEIKIKTNEELSIKEVLEKVCEMLDEDKRKILKQKLFSQDSLQSGVIILLNGQNILHLENLNTKAKAGDVISIFPPGGGG